MASPFGRPRKELDDGRVQSLLSSGISKTRICAILKVSRPTLNSYISSHQLNNILARDNLSNDQIDDITKRAKAELPSFGEKMTVGYFRATGLKLTRRQIRESIHRVDPDGVVDRRNLAYKRIRRRVYSSPYPHYMWHIDGNHKLIRWRLVIHIGIDGFSRTCVYMRCSDNNRASTVLQCFGEALDDFNVTPTRIRSDHGGENVMVWQAMLQHRNEQNPNPVVVGSSVHNQRVERFNREVNRHVRDKYAAIFYKLEDEDRLDIENPIDVFCLHFVFIPRVNKSLAVLKLSHNSHAIRTEGSLTPAQLIAVNWHLRENLDAHQAVPGQLITDLDNYPVESFSMTPVNNPLTEERYEELCDLINPLHEDNNNGIQLYLACRYFVQAHT